MVDQALLSSKRQTWGTPRGLFQFVNDALDLRTDAAASKQNALLPQFWTEKDDGLAQDWSESGPIWCNPPYGRAISEWVDKCAREALNGCRVCLLIPSRTDTEAWHRYILAPQTPFHRPTVIFVRSRLTFSGGKAPAPFPSALILWGWSSWDLVRRFSEARSVSRREARREAQAKSERKGRRASQNPEAPWLLVSQPGRFWTLEGLRT